MGWLTVKNWAEFQHYKDRNPPWIKLHRTILDDYSFASLPDRSKAHLMLIWVFASQNEGRIPNDQAFLERKLGFEKAPDLSALLAGGWLIAEQDASEPLAECKQDAPLDRDTKASQKRERKKPHALPADYKITDEMRVWCAENSFDNPEASLDYMRDWAAGGGHLRADWDATLRNCIKGDWGKARENARALRPSTAPISSVPTCCMCPKKAVMRVNGASYCDDHAQRKAA